MSRFKVARAVPMQSALPEPLSCDLALLRAQSCGADRGGGIIHLRPGVARASPAAQRHHVSGLMFRILNRLRRRTNIHPEATSTPTRMLPYRSTEEDCENSAADPPKK